MKKTKIYVISFIIICLVITSVFAISELDKIRAELSSTATELKSGQEVIVTLKFDQYVNIGKGINAFKAKLEYDENIFEKIEASNFEAKNSWEELQYNQDTKEFVAIKKARSKQPEDIVQIKLRVKENINGGKTLVKMADIVTSEGTEDILMDNIELSIGKEETPITGKLGDTDGNGEITTKDAKMVLQHIAGKITLTEEQRVRGDASKDKNITTKDAKLILQHIAGKIELE